MQIYLPCKSKTKQKPQHMPVLYTFRSIILHILHPSVAIMQTLAVAFTIIGSVLVTRAMDDGSTVLKLMNSLICSVCFLLATLLHFPALNVLSFGIVFQLSDTLVSMADETRIAIGLLPPDAPRARLMEKVAGLSLCVIGMWLGGAAPFVTNVHKLIPKLTRPRIESLVVWLALLSLGAGVITVFKVSRETISLELPVTSGLIGCLFIVALATDNVPASWICLFLASSLQLYCLDLAFTTSKTESVDGKHMDIVAGASLIWVGLVIIAFFLSSMLRGIDPGSSGLGHANLKENLLLSP